MAELHVNKSAFDACYEAFKKLSSQLQKETFSLETSEDTSLTGKKERQCCEILQKMISDLAALADETAEDVRKTQTGYVDADE